MLFDLRVVLAACLATVFFAAVGFGMVAALRSPLKASAGYPSDGPVFAGPGLPRGQPIFTPTPNQPEVTGSIPAASDPAPGAAAAKDHPAAKGEKSIANLIEEDAKKAAAAKHKAAEKEKRRQAWLRAKALKKKKQEQQKASPWANYFNNNSPTRPSVQ